MCRKAAPNQTYGDRLADPKSRVNDRAVIALVLVDPAAVGQGCEKSVPDANGSGQGLADPALANLSQFRFILGQ